MTTVHPNPSAEETAAIAAALELLNERQTESVERRESGWTIAMRRPELSFDDVRAIVRVR